MDISRFEDVFLKDTIKIIVRNPDKLYLLRTSNYRFFQDLFSEIWRL